MSIIFKRFILSTAIAAALTLVGCAAGKTADTQDTKEEAVTEAVNETDTPTAETVEASEETLISETDVTNEERNNEVAFTDALGREITVGSPERVVTLLGSFCDMWKLAGGDVVGTAKDSWTAFDLDLPEDVINVGSFLEPDLEQIIAASPDLVIASAGADAQVELLDTFEGVGINVAYFEVSDFDEYLSTLNVFTQITGRSDLYEKYGTSIAQEIEEQMSRIDDSHPTVLFIRAAASSVKAKGSEGTVGGEILADLGCINIADSDDSLLEDLSLEAIVAADPDYIFVTTQGEDTEAALANVQELLKDNPAWSSLSAVENGNYYEIEKALYNSKPNARWGEAYKKLADILYD